MKLQYVERSLESLDWITIILVGSFVLLAITKLIYPKRFDEFIILPLTNKYFLVQGKSDNIIHPFNVLLFLFQIISVSLFIYLFFSEDAKMNSWLYLQICTVYTVFILVKLTIEKIIGTVFSLESVINRYLYQKLSYRNLLSLFIFIGNLIFFFIIKPNFNTLLYFAGSILLFNSIALFYNYKSNRNFIYSNFFYFILYLCALEISPYVILYKVLV